MLKFTTFLLLDSLTDLETHCQFSHSQNAQNEV